MDVERRVKVFRGGGDQVVIIPPDLEFFADEAVLRRDGDRLIIEPVRRKSLLELLDSLEPLDEEFPDVDEDLPPLREIEP